MFQAVVITLREGLEAFLIIAISLAYLRKRGLARTHFGGALGHCPLAAGERGCGVSVPTGWEGILALVAAASVASLTVHMWRTARKIKGQIEGQLRASAGKTGRAARGSVLFHAPDDLSRGHGVYGQYLTYLLVAVPLGWLLFAITTGVGPPPAGSATSERAA